MKALQAVWRLVRVAGISFGAQVGVTNVHPSKAAIVAGAVAAAETLYRVAVPAKEKSRLLAIVQATRAVLDVDRTLNRPSTSIPTPPAPIPQVLAPPVAPAPAPTSSRAQPAPVLPHVEP